MERYNQFCVVVIKETEVVLPDFKQLHEKVFFKGKMLSENIVGNIYSYKKEIGIRELEEGISKNPKAFLKDFVGDFSFVVLGESISPLPSLIAVRDHIGIFPLYYYHDDNMLIIANDQRLMIDIPGINLTPDVDWIGNFIASDHESWENTFYLHIKKVPPAHILRFENNNLSLERYWDLDIHKKHPEKSDEQYIAEFRELLQEAVESRIPDGVNIGNEVSGGIDCTSIASIAKSYLDKYNRNLFTYAHSAFDSEHFPSERKAIDKYLTYLKPFKHTYVPSQMIGMRKIAEKAFQLRNGVPDSHYALFSQEIYEKAQQDNVKVIFSGNGGDHCVSYKGSGMIFREQIKNRQWKRVFNELKISQQSSFSAFLKFSRILIRTIISNPFPKKEENILQDKRQKSLEKMIEFFPSLKEYQIQKKVVEKHSSLAEVLYHKVLVPEVVNRSEATTISATDKDVLYRYPLLDIRLLQYFISLPPHMLYQKKQNRYIFRETIKHWVPQYLAYQPKPPANMYGWIIEAYKYDYENKIEYNIVPKDEEIRLYYEYWKLRDEQCYTGNNNFKDGKINEKLLSTLDA